MEKKVNFILKKSTRKKTKWVVIFLNTVTTLIGAFTGNLALLYLPALLFWVYVMLDKFNPLTKNTRIGKIVKKEKKIKLSKLKETESYDNSHESGY